MNIMLSMVRSLQWPSGITPVQVLVDRSINAQLNNCLVYIYIYICIFVGHCTQCLQKCSCCVDMALNRLSEPSCKLQTMQKDLRLAINMSDIVDQPLHVGSAVNEVRPSFYKLKSIFLSI